jgi:hypothetical protein
VGHLKLPDFELCQIDLIGQRELSLKNPSLLLQKKGILVIHLYGMAQYG